MSFVRIKKSKWKRLPEITRPDIISDKNLCCREVFHVIWARPGHKAGGSYWTRSSSTSSPPPALPSSPPPSSSLTSLDCCKRQKNSNGYLNAHSWVGLKQSIEHLIEENLQPPTGKMGGTLGGQKEDWMGSHLKIFKLLKPALYWGNYHSRSQE